MRRFVVYALIFGLLAIQASASVRDFGAKGDGTTDDTAAFQKAMDECAKSGGGIVEVPAGKYLIKTSLSVPPSVTLEGIWRAPASVSEYHDPKDPKGGPALDGSVLLAVDGAGKPDGTAFISLHRNSCLKGLTIFYPEQTKTNPPVAYPWTVQCAGADNCSIVDVLMVNPYQAVDFGSRASGRHYIRGLYAQPLLKGVYLDQCLDVGRIENVHLWPFWTAGDGDSPVGKFMLEKGEAFIFGRSDWEYVTNCFAIGYKVGMRFIKGIGTGPYAGGGNYLLTQSGADCCDIAVLVDETQGHSGVSFSNSQIFGDIIVSETNDGMVRFTGCGLFGSMSGKNGTALAKIAGRGRVSFDNCHFYCIHPEDKGEAIVLAESGRLSIDDCVFINSKVTAVNPTPIILQPGVRSAIITSNEFYGKMKIVNKSLGTVVIKDNVEETDTHPFPKWKAPARPKEEIGAIVVDDADGPSNVSFVGEWNLVENRYDLTIGYYKGTRWAWKGDGSAKAIFKPAVLKTGMYAVYIYTGPDPASDHATNAPVEVKSADGTHKTTISLKGRKGEWVKIGTYRFAKGRMGTITLSNNADGNVLADAVKLVPGNK